MNFELKSCETCKNSIFLKSAHGYFKINYCSVGLSDICKNKNCYEPKKEFEDFIKEEEMIIE